MVLKRVGGTVSSDLPVGGTASPDLPVGGSVSFGLPVGGTASFGLPVPQPVKPARRPLPYFKDGKLVRPGDDVTIPAQVQPAVDANMTQLAMRLKPGAAQQLGESAGESSGESSGVSQEDKQTTAADMIGTEGSKVERKTPSFICPVCHKTKALYARARHMLQHVLKCNWPQCQFVANDAVELVSHLHEHNQTTREKTEEGEDTWRCNWPDCEDYSVKRKDVLGIHLKTHNKRSG